MNDPPTHLFTNPPTLPPIHPPIRPSTCILIHPPIHTQIPVYLSPFKYLSFYRYCLQVRKRMGGWVNIEERLGRRLGVASSLPSTHPPTHPPTLLTSLQNLLALDLKGRTFNCYSPEEQLATGTVRRVGGWVVGWMLCLSSFELCAFFSTHPPTHPPTHISTGLYLYAYRGYVPEEPGHRPGQRVAEHW